MQRGDPGHDRRWLACETHGSCFGESESEDDHILFEAALQRQKDSAQPLSRRAAFQVVWRERQLGSDADAAKAEQRFKSRLAHYRGGRDAPPVEWRRPGSRLAEVLGL